MSSVFKIQKAPLLTNVYALCTMYSGFPKVSGHNITRQRPNLRPQNSGMLEPYTRQRYSTRNDQIYDGLRGEMGELLFHAKSHLGTELRIWGFFLCIAKRACNW